MSIRKRIWTTPDGAEHSAWQADYVDAQGKRRRKAFAKKKDAEAFLLTARSEVRSGTHVPDSETITVAEAGKLWLQTGAAAGLERTTMDQRRQHLELHIKPLAGDVKLNKLTVPWVRSFQDQLREAGRSAAMVKRVTVSLGSIVADAQARGLTIRNPVHEASRARSSTKPAEKRAKAKLVVGRDIPTNDEVRALLAAATGRWRPLLIVAAFAGLRASELRGLRWADIDLDGGIITVRQRADRYRDIGAPKSSAGQRQIPVPPFVVNTLKEWKLACPKGTESLAFPNTEGGIEFHQNMVHRGLWPSWVAAGVTVPGKAIDEAGEPIPVPKYPGFHALRHWFASWCINRARDGGLELTAKAVQQRMGHSSIQVTFDTYAGLFPVEDEQHALNAAALRVLNGT